MSTSEGACDECLHADLVIWVDALSEPPFEFATYVIPCSDGAAIRDTFTISQARGFHAALVHALSAHDAKGTA